MSNDSNMRVWVGDLDGYIDIGAISASNSLEDQEEEIEEALIEIGEIALFAGKTVSSRALYSRGVNSDKWRWAQHSAQKSLGQAQTRSEIEAAFLKAIIDYGRRYAIARYATFEGLSYSSAITATFPHGIRALLYKYMVSEPLLADRTQRIEIQKTLQHARSAPDLTAYERAGEIRKGLHYLAIAAGGPEGHLCLDRDGMREMLSLCRLHFLALECRARSVSELQKMKFRYELAHIEASRECDKGQVLSGKYIQNWKMRHQHPLFFFFPYCIRNALARATFQDIEGTTPFDRKTAVNELALTICGIELMQTKAKKGRTVRND